MDLPARFRLSLISHFDSPLPSDVTLPVSGNPGGLFQTDITGDGTGDGTFGSNGGLGDLLPGTNIGGFGRSFGVNGLNQKISSFNNNMVGQATPAGQVLINNGLFTLAQLQDTGRSDRRTINRRIYRAGSGSGRRDWSGLAEDLRSELELGIQVQRPG